MQNNIFTKNKDKKQKTGLNIGASSILVVFIILSMVTFSVLSYVAATSDYKLSQDVANRNTAYYRACSEGYKQLSALASAPRMQTELADFNVVIDETQSIHIIANLPADGMGDSINIICWQVVDNE